MKTILFVSNFGTFLGGGEISLFDLIRRLDSSQFERVVVCPEKGEFYSQIESLGIPVQVTEMPGLKGAGLFSLPFSVRQLLALIKMREVEIIHANGSRCMIYAGLAGRLAGLPVIWHLRVPGKDPILDPFLAMLATKIITNSRAVSQRVRFRWSSQEICVVHNGVDLGKFNSNLEGDGIRQEFSIPGEDKVVTIVGRLDGWKGHRFFLEAAQKVTTQFNASKFLVVGDGALRNELEALSKDLGIESNVLFCGSRNDIPEILAASDILVSASLDEGFGRVVIEAMAMAKPVVGTRSGGVPEIVMDGETGILVEPENSEDLAQAIRSLLADPERASEMGVAGLNRVKNSFSLEKHTREIEEIYKAF